MEPRQRNLATEPNVRTYGIGTKGQNPNIIYPSHRLWLTMWLIWFRAASPRSGSHSLVPKSHDTISHHHSLSDTGGHIGTMPSWNPYLVSEDDDVVLGPELWTTRPSIMKFLFCDGHKVICVWDRVLLLLSRSLVVWNVIELLARIEQKASSTTTTSWLEEHSWNVRRKFWNILGTLFVPGHTSCGRWKGYLSRDTS